jgi:hypothetical protein
MAYKYFLIDANVGGEVHIKDCFLDERLVFEHVLSGEFVKSLNLGKRLNEPFPLNVESSEGQ